MFDTMAMKSSHAESLLRDMRRQADAGDPISREQAEILVELPQRYLWDLFATAQAAKNRHFPDDRPILCSIINAKSGACPEDCAFCSQSAHHQTEIPVYPLKPTAEIVSARTQASRLPVRNFGVVTSGPRLDQDELRALVEMIRAHPAETVPYWCASLGSLDENALGALRDAGLKRYHHNLETASSFFPRVCTTHSYAERLATVKCARKVGLEVCCGGILGMGETWPQRVEFALALQELAVQSIPLNFLIPLPGTRLGGLEPIPPREALRTIAMFRLLNPAAEIRVCAGRRHLRDLQAMIFGAGANGMMIGDLLTVAGRNVPDDLQMLRDLGYLPDDPAMDR